MDARKYLGDCQYEKLINANLIHPSSILEQNTRKMQ